MILFSFSLKIINVVTLDPNIFLLIAASIAAAGVNLKWIKAL